MRLFRRKSSMWRKAMHARRELWRDTPVGPERLRLLVDWARIRVVPMSTPSLQRARREFNRSKDEWRGHADAGACACCGRLGPRVWHHLVQLQYGGNNSPNNVVKVCPPCHAVIHPHLPMTSDEPITAAVGGNVKLMPRLIRTKRNTQIDIGALDNPPRASRPTMT